MTAISYRSAGDRGGQQTPNSLFSCKALWPFKGGLHITRQAQGSWGRGCCLCGDGSGGVHLL
eukprot:129552-Alexandrium_andersonii.AAC.1